MKLPAVLLVGSLVVNAALFAAFTRRPAAESPAPQVRELKSMTGAGGQNGNENSTGVDSSRQSARAAGGRARDEWAALDTGDLSQLPARLRAAGFPPTMIRAIITSRIDALFAPRMKELAASIAELPVWKQDPRAAMNAQFNESRTQLMLERTRMLRDVLGGDLTAWAENPDAARRRQFGDVPPDKIDLVQRITEDYAEMASQVRASTQGIMLPEDREKLALLERERRTDLAAILGPRELEEYEMRTSRATTRLRSAMTVMDATEEEFRTIFRIYEPFNDRINPGAAGGLVIGPVNITHRDEVTAEMMAQLKAALPPDRYAAFARGQDREYQQLDAIARQNNIPSETAVRAYNLRDQYSANSNRIADDRTLSQEQKRSALTSLGAEARAQIMGTLGPAAGEAYAQGANWLAILDTGRAFTPRPEGGVTTRVVAPPPSIGK